METRTRFRSRYRNYRVGNVQFDNCVAVVDERVADQIRRDPSFGEGKDFWEDVAPPPESVEAAKSHSSDGLDVNFLDECVKLGVLERNGSWYAFGETRLGNGAAAALDFLHNTDNTEIALKIVEAHQAKAG